MSITNSNSNFGARALNASGFRPDAFSQDDKGYITHIIPPKEIPIEKMRLNLQRLMSLRQSVFLHFAHLYLFNETNIDSPPENVLEGYRIGAREMINYQSCSCIQWRFIRI